MILAAGYLLWMFQRVAFGELSEFLKGLGSHLTDMRPVEALTLVPLGALVVVFGLFPGLILDLVSGSVTSTLNAVLQGAPIALGGETCFPFDVIRWDGSVYSKLFDGAAHGVPAGVEIDALAVDGTDLLLSFDVGVTLAGTYFADEDLVRWDGASFSSFFDGSAAGLDPALDLDGAHRLANGHLLLSFDGSGLVDGVAFTDEDALEYDPGSGGWELAFDGSSADPSWVEADLDAVSAGERVVAIPTLAAIELAALALLLLCCALILLRRAP